MDSVTSGGIIIGTRRKADGKNVQVIELSQMTGVDGAYTDIPVFGTTAAPSAAVMTVQGNAGGVAIPVSGPLTDTQLRATAVPVSGTFFQATQPVSGAFFQATQPVSGPLTDAQLRATEVPVSGPITDAQARATPLPVMFTNTGIAIIGNVEVMNDVGNPLPVSGTFWQATQPVSGPLTDIQLRATALPVSGTFFQATQPVSAAALPLPAGAAQEHVTAAGFHSVRLTDGAAFYKPTTPTDTQPVSGVFWQATQPVSGVFWQATQPVSGPLTDAQLRAAAVPVSGTFFQATQPVSGPLTDTQLRASAVPVSGTFFQAIQPVSGTVAVTQPTLTKGTQGATGVSTQDLKDSGRNQCNYFMAAQVLSTASDVLQSLTGYKSGAAVGATATPAVVTTGKTYRIKNIMVTYVAVATAGGIKVTLRANLTGVVALTSPAVTTWLIGGPAAAAGVSQTVTIDIPDGMEFAAGTGIGISVQGVGATGTAAAAGYAQVAIDGYEY